MNFDYCLQTKKTTKTIKKHSTVINNFYFFVLNFVSMFVLESRQVGDVQNLVLIFWNFNIIRKIILEYKNYKTWKLKKINIIILISL